MRFGLHAGRKEAPSRIESRPEPVAAQPARAQEAPHPAPQPPLVRRARKDGRPVAVLRTVEHDGACVVEAEVQPRGSVQLAHPGPYTFSDVHEAGAFVNEAVTALMYLGCDVEAE